MTERRNERVFHPGVCALLVLWPLTSCLAADPDTEIVRAQLKTETYVTEVLAQRQRLVSSLLAVIDDGEATMRQRMRAVTIVGEIRAGEAVAVLIRNVDAVRPVHPSINPEERAPCLAALRKIGKPSTRPLLSELLRPIPRHQRTMFTMVLLGIEGGKVSNFLLREALAEAKSQSERSRLEQSLELLGKLRPGQPQGRWKRLPPKAGSAEAKAPGTDGRSNACGQTDGPTACAGAEGAARID
ncbi:MAG: hypothetical protein ACYS9X_07795 [Planctomycetota bacterium]|jgi:hypothetical protein